MHGHPRPPKNFAEAVDNLFMDLDHARTCYSKVRDNHPTLVGVERAVQNFQESTRKSKPKRMSWLGRTGAGKSTTINNGLFSTCIKPEDYKTLEDGYKAAGRYPDAGDTKGKQDHFFMKEYTFSDETSKVNTL